MVAGAGLRTMAPIHRLTSRAAADEDLPARVGTLSGRATSRRRALPRIAARARAGFLEEFLGILRGLRPWRAVPALHP